MAIYWPTPSFKGRTFKLCVVTRWAFNVCSRSSPLRGSCYDSRLTSPSNSVLCLMRKRKAHVRFLSDSTHRPVVTSLCICRVVWQCLMVHDVAASRQTSNFPQGINEVVLYCIESVWNMLWLVLYVFFQSVGETGLNVSSASNMGRKLLGLVCFWWRT